MNLEKLFKAQKELDDHINKVKGLEGRDLLDKKILALLVELGELANELPEEFKFWSNKKNNYEKAPEEYVDGLHFILSIGNDLGGMEFLAYYSMGTPFNKNITDTLSDLISSAVWFKEKVRSDYPLYFNKFLDLGEQLGFTWKQIEQAYFKKRETNFKRQENGY